MVEALDQKEPLVTRSITLEDFLAFEDGTDARYELENGRLVFMPSESDLNQRIAMFLLVYLAQQGSPFYWLRIGLEIVVSGIRDSVRLPDLTLLTEASAQALAGSTRSIILSNMPPPRWVVEIVSPGQDNRDRDYRYKRAQYQARGIAEYWIVDPLQNQITVLTWVEGLYEEAVFHAEQPILSSLLQDLGISLTAAQVFTPS